ITIACGAASACAGSTHTIAVSLVVSAPPPQLSLGTTLLSFSATGTTPQTLSQFLNVQNSGGGTITVNSISAPDSWISISGAPSTLSAGQATEVTLTASTSRLAAGYYQSTLTVASS